MRVEILQDLAPKALDGAVALVDDDDDEGVGRQCGVVTDLYRVGDGQLINTVLVDLFVQLLLTFQDGEDALHR